jgi:hypothetical protein
LPISFELIESKEQVLALTEEAAMNLRRVGRELASKTEWWGADPETPSPERTVIEAEPAGSGLWRIQVRDAVGVIVLRDVQLHIRPKIPAEHFLYLARRSDKLPRTAGYEGTGSSGPLWELVTLWFLDAAEQLLRRGLIRDYAAVRETLGTIRGHVDVQSAAHRYYSGALLFDCSFDDHVEDNAPNRLMKAAAAYIAASPLPDSIRRRARRILVRLDAVGDLSDFDKRWMPDRRTEYYRIPITLARHVLRTMGRSLSSGADIVWTFLIRTPELIEDGIRAVLEESLGVDVVTKTRIQLRGSSMTFNPDLRFWGSHAVADVKYKLTAGEWNRSDLYQVLAFAASLRCLRSAVINFTLVSGIPVLSPLTVGEHRVTTISWPAGERDPARAARLFTGSVEEWLSSV